jgi:hypothetical protein
MSDPVHQDAQDGKWYFWDETWADRCGPYDTREIADQKAKEYGDYLTYGPRPIIAGIEVNPVLVTLKFSSKQHLVEVVQAFESSISHCAGKPSLTVNGSTDCVYCGRPVDSVQHQQEIKNSRTLETLRDVYKDVLEALSLRSSLRSADPLKDA